MECMEQCFTGRSHGTLKIRDDYSSLPGQEKFPELLHFFKLLLYKACEKVNLRLINLFYFQGLYEKHIIYA